MKSALRVSALTLDRRAAEQDGRGAIATVEPTTRRDTPTARFLNRQKVNPMALRSLAVCGELLVRLAARAHPFSAAALCVCGPEDRPGMGSVLHGTHSIRNYGLCVEHGRLLEL